MTKIEELEKQLEQERKLAEERRVKDKVIDKAQRKRISVKSELKSLKRERRFGRLVRATRFVGRGLKATGKTIGKGTVIILKKGGKLQKKLEKTGLRRERLDVLRRKSKPRRKSDNGGFGLGLSPF